MREGHTPVVVSSGSEGQSYVQVVNDICDDLAAEAQQSLSVRHVHRRLRELRTGEPADLMLAALEDACAHRLLGPERVHERPYALLAPMTDEDISEDTFERWATAAQQADLHPLVRSRVADLLWVYRRPRPDRWYRLAIETFLELSGTQAWVLDRQAGLGRAVEISRETGQPELAQAPLEALSGLTRVSLDSAENEYGVVARALGVLVENEHPCRDLIDVALAKFADDPWHVADLGDLASRTVDVEEERLRLRSLGVRAFEEAAERTDGPRRVSLLDTARALATRIDLPEEARRLQALIEQTDLEDSWITHTETFEFDKDEMQPLIDQIVGDDSLREALLRFGSYAPISDRGDAREFLSEMREQHPLSHLFPTMHIGPENSLTHVPSDHALAEDIELAQYDARAIEVFASVTGREILEATRERYAPDQAALIRGLTSKAIEAEMARRIAISFAHWEKLDNVSAVSVIALALEPVVRRICAGLGINVTTPGTGDVAIGSVRSLGALIGALSERIGDYFPSYLQAALVNRWSMNLRNNVAHGLAPELTGSQYVVLFHIACVLAHIDDVLSQGQDASADGDRP